ncbi:MAG: hypothetical protein KA248_07810 [Kiritimatiellae bacterium]|nr:hypothetical protein [Kiritimatiellia bacterium]
MKHLLAGGAEEGLFWFVMAIIWVVVQIVSRVTKKQLRRGTPPRPAPAAEKTESSLEEFLRSLGAEPMLPPKPVQEPEPMPQAAPEPEPVPAIRVRKRRAPRPLAPAAPAGEPPPVVALPRLAPEAGVMAEGKRMRGMMVIPKIPVVRVQGLRVPALAFGGNTVSNVQAGSNRFPLKGREALRQAMLHRLILEPPHYASGP